ncbi:MAG: hypothetical protein L0228_21015 [Planctomycetes bacterium]|nr:hypothetical protein [Planctomycetota bacterium]
MRDWLTIELVLATLLVTSFTCVGLLALWAATSPRHWFLRTAIVLTVLAPLLLIPAYEPFVVFALQCGIIAIGVAVYRKSSLSRRFSLLTFLLAVVLVAMCALIAIRLPRLNVHGWSTLVLNGLGAGVATLVGGWWCVGRRKIVAWPLGVIVCLVIGFLLSMFDWFFPSIANYTSWPPELDAIAAILPGFGSTERPIATWFFIPPLIALATWLALLTLNAAAIRLNSHHSATDGTSTQPAKRLRVIARFAVVAGVVTFAAFPCFVLSKLLTPDPLPNTSLPTPNGYDDLLAAGRLVSATKFSGGAGGNFDYETATQKELAAEVAKSEPSYERLTIGLSRPCLVPIEYYAGDLPDIIQFRALARSVAGKARLAELEGRFDDAADAYIQVMTLGYVAPRGGLIIDGMVGVAMTSFGTPGIYRARKQLSLAKVGACIDALARLDANDEPYRDIEYRDRVWVQRSSGWHGHLAQLLTDIADHDWGVPQLLGVDGYETVFAKRKAEVRLLISELALTRFHHDHDRWPAALAELVPKYLPAIPADPFDPTGQPIRYLRTDETYVLYSVGANGADEGGAAPKEDDFPGMPQSGDLRLDLHFVPDSSASSPDSMDAPTNSDSYRE